MTMKFDQILFKSLDQKRKTLRYAASITKGYYEELPKVLLWQKP